VVLIECSWMLWHAMCCVVYDYSDEDVLCLAAGTVISKGDSEKDGTASYPCILRGGRPYAHAFFI
jgi:hypothetical protein